MSELGPTSQPPQPPVDDASAPASSPAVDRLARFTAANMLRSLVPLVVICLLLVAWVTFRQSGDVGLRTVDPASTEQLAAARAGYQVLVPSALEGDWRTTSARTDAGNAAEGGSVTLEIGYLTPTDRYAGFVVTDDASSAAITDVLEDAQEGETVVLDRRSWVTYETERGEQALVFSLDGVTAMVTGSAPSDELAELAAAVRPYTP